MCRSVRHHHRRAFEAARGAQEDSGRAFDAPRRADDVPAQPVVAEPHDLRASDAERESAVEALRAHAAAGRLDAEELEQRVERALTARTRADLARLLEDLPAAARPRPVVARPRARRNGKDPRALVAIAILLVAIWALTGAGYFWPAWPLLWFAFASLGRGWHRGLHAFTRSARGPAS